MSHSVINVAELESSIQLVLALLCNECYVNSERLSKTRIEYFRFPLDSMNEARLKRPQLEPKEKAPSIGQFDKSTSMMPHKVVR